MDGWLKGSYRFFNNPRVTEGSLIEYIEDECAQKVEGKEVLGMCDTVSLNFNNHKRRITNFEGLGTVSTNREKACWGFLMHPILVLDSQDKTPLGFGGLKLITRPLEPYRIKSKRYETKNYPIEKKESNKWLEPCEQSKNNSLLGAKHITFVMDREGDIMEVYDRLKDEKTDVLVRAKHNRNIEIADGSCMRLFDFVSNQKVSGSKSVKIVGCKRKHRLAEVGIKFGSCKLIWHSRQKVEFKNNPTGVKVSIIEVEEKEHSGYANEPKLNWKLITTKEIKTIEEAKKEISNYEQRWRIEELFKLLKSDGFNVEKTELQQGKSIRKLCIMSMNASMKVLQLKAARSGEGKMEVSDIFDDDEIKCLIQLNEEMSGETEKQCNPYDPKHLSWASWIIARLGGWKGFYNKKRPPGNKTFVWGIQKFESIMIGFNISKKKDVS